MRGDRAPPRRVGHLPQTKQNSGVRWEIRRRNRTALRSSIAREGPRRARAMPHFSVKFGDVASPNGTEGAVFNANCQCRILLDQICITAMRELEDYARKRDAGLKAALEELAGQIAFQQAHAPKPPPEDEADEDAQARYEDAHARWQADGEKLEAARALKEAQSDELQRGTKACVFLREFDAEGKPVELEVEKDGEVVATAPKYGAKIAPAVSGSPAAPPLELLDADGKPVGFAQAIASDARALDFVKHKGSYTLAKIEGGVPVPLTFEIQPEPEEPAE